MVRKILCCIVILALMSFFVLPAFASSSGSGYKIYCDLPITELIINDGIKAGSVIDWPRSAAYDGSVVITDFTDTSSSVPFCSIHSFKTPNLDNEGSEFNNSIYLPTDVTSFSLYIENYFFDGRGILTLPVDLGTSFSYISVSGVYSYVDEDDSLYTIVSPVFSQNWTFTTQQDILDLDLHSYIRTAAGFSGSTTPYYLTCTVEVGFYPVSSNSIPVFYHGSYGLGSELSSDYRNWFDNQQLVHSSTTIVEGGLFDWLLDSVNALFNIQIAPGITLNTMFVVTLVIVVLLAVIKIMH